MGPYPYQERFYNENLSPRITYALARAQLFYANTEAALHSGLPREWRGSAFTVQARLKVQVQGK